MIPQHDLLPAATLAPHPRPRLSKIHRIIVTTLHVTPLPLHISRDRTYRRPQTNINPGPHHLHPNINPGRLLHLKDLGYLLPTTTQSRRPLPISKDLCCPLHHNTIQSRRDLNLSRDRSTNLGRLPLLLLLLLLHHHHHHHHSPSPTLMPQPPT